MLILSYLNAKVCFFFIKNRSKKTVVVKLEEWTIIFTELKGQWFKFMNGKDKYRFSLIKR